jgi:NTP pyrophosphatase (non-canonical NTP hydrolase)
MIQYFESKQIGKVNHVDFVAKFGKGNKIHHSAYLHFDSWYDTKASKNMQSDLEVGKEVRMYYDEPWYWQIYKNETKKFGGNGQRKERLVLEKPAIQEKEPEEEKEPEIFKEEDFSTTFTQEEIDEIERMILEEQEFQEQEEEFQECFGWVDARYAELLEAKLAFYENQNQYVNCV